MQRVWVLLGAMSLGVSGCAVPVSHKGAGKGAKTTSAHPMQGKEPRAALSEQPWIARIGKVVLVDAVQGFALVDIGTAPTPETGAELRAYRVSEAQTAGDKGTRGVLSAQMVVSRFQKSPYLIVDILRGLPEAGQDVVPVEKRGVRSESQEAPAESIASATPSAVAVGGSATGRSVKSRVSPDATQFFSVPPPTQVSGESKAASSEMLRGTQIFPER